MQTIYEAPELTVLGEAHELVMGGLDLGYDGDTSFGAWDFEFAQD